MIANQLNCAMLLDVTQFSYNLQRNESTNSMFKPAIGQQLLTPNTLDSTLGEESIDAQGS